MSRLPQQVYGYHPATAYYYEEVDDAYIGDYSESDGVSETPPHMATGAADLTELFRRKMVGVQTQHDVYQQQQQQRSRQHQYQQQLPYYYAQDCCYYYEPQPVLQRRPVVTPPPTPPAHPVKISASAYRRRLPGVQQGDRIAHFYATEAVDDAYAAVAYRSQPQIAQQKTQRPVTAREVPSATLTQAGRRHPVTVRTPRFFRRSQTASMRKPSTLCLPVNCQPDPVKKSKGQVYSVQKKQEKKADEEVEMKPDEAGDIDAVPSDLDTMLNKYERMFAEGRYSRSVKKDECEPIRSTTTVPSCKALKPRPPPSVKARQERLQKLKLKSSKASLKQSATSVTSKNGRVEVEEITTEVLDQLLEELMNNGCENKLQHEKPKEEASAKTEVKKETVSEQQPSDEGCQVEAPEVQPGSINYKEISQHLFEVEQQQKEARATKVNERRKFDVSSQASQKEDCGSICPQISRSAYYHPQAGRVPLEEALELHKSKSYIVNLIDRALSKELGTLPEIKFKEVPCAISGATSTDTMVKNTQTKTDRDLCVEVSQALTEPYPPPHCVESKQELCCPCAHQREEPLYLRQLRQLRWGHLKHIQREVRRLEDLERFLDSCSSTSNF